jgi:hypothetical integral membrane protein (TIGR02206 family)
MDTSQPAASAWETFTSYRAVHLVSVAACLIIIVAVARAASQLRDKTAERRMRHALAAAAIGFWIAYNTWWNWNGIDTFNGLPLQICDVNGLLAPLALLTRNRWLRATLYFWAFAFAVQAFVQPTLAEGPAKIGFWAFWAAHTIILSCAVYDVVALRFRPDWSDLGRAALASAVYLVIVLPVNSRLGSNYGYVGNPPPGQPIPPLVEAFGPWPERVVIIVALAALAFLVVLAPWRLVRRAQAGRDAGPRTVRRSV